MLNTKQKGNLTELKCLTKFVELGYSVSIPYGENSRYDFILDYNGELLKIQVKTAKLAQGTEENPETIEFATCSMRYNSGGGQRVYYTKDEIDYFATWWDNEVYLVPVEECSVSKKLRFVPPKNGQRVGISFCKDYIAEKVLERRQA